MGLVLNAIYPPDSYDTSMPQGWLEDVVRITGLNPYGHIVWSYDNYADGSPSITGRPHPVTMEGLEIMQQLALRQGIQ